jgi:hypothetical protein
MYITIGFVCALVWVFYEGRRQRRRPLPPAELGDRDWLQVTNERDRRWMRLVFPACALTFGWPFAVPMLGVLYAAGFR